MSTCRRHGRDQPAGHVGDPDLLAHVEDEHLAVPADDRGLQHELHRLVRGHEVAADLGVGHRDRAARGDLRAQRGQHRAPAAEHVAEPDAQVGARGLAGHVRGEPLGGALGVAEHADRVGGLVRGDVHERLDAAGRGRVQHRAGAPHVRLQRLGRVPLQQRQVLQRSGVEHDLRLELLEDLPDAARVADVGQHRPVGVQQRAPVQGQLHRVQRRLVPVQHDQLGRARSGAAGGTARTRWTRRPR